MSLYVAAAALAAALPLLGWTLLAGYDPDRKVIQRNLDRGMDVDISREAKPARDFGALGRKLVSHAMVARLERLLTYAGRPPAWPLARVVAAKPVLAVVAGALGLLVLSTSPGAGMVLLFAGVTVVAYFVPDLLLYSRGVERQRAIALELPDTLDQMTIAVEAGLGFEAAMSRAAHTGKGPLAAELSRTLQDMQVGQSRREAYTALAGRTTVVDLRRFVRAVIRADVYGVATAGVLRSQASEMRLKRRQRAEEKAMQVPVKVIFPLMLCILPVLFIVLLGPVAIQVMQTFG